MMSKIPTLICSTAAALLFSVTLNAQSGDNDLSRTEVSTRFVTTTSFTPDAREISSTARAHFVKTFAVDTEEWSNSSYGSRATFRKDGVTHLVDYNKKGKWSSTLRIYGEKNLPKDVRSQVRSVYYDYSIVTVSELTVPQHLIYFVKVENETTLKTVRIANGEMEQIQEFNRGDK